MRALVDTNVLVRTLEIDHPEHRFSADILERAADNSERFALVPQVLYEFWVVATRPRKVNGLGLNCSEANLCVEEFENTFTILPDPPELYTEWRALVSHYRISGKPAHDARLAAAMRLHNLSQLITINGRDFSCIPQITCIAPRDYSITP